jgi:hypothetical protein
MAVKEILQEIENEVIDVTKTNFVYINTDNVPSLGDNAMTYEKGVEKKGKLLKTCVLYVDIRDSVALTEKHHNQTMGRIYTSFTKAVLKIARHHKGHTRNIIGDRVMIVFPAENCFINAVHCAISINHIATSIIQKQFPDVNFKCGIGIDFGELRVIKVGIQRRGVEHGENKGLIWTGYPANIASRLTDSANKSIEEVYYKVTRNPINPKHVNKSLFSLYAAAFPKPNFPTPKPQLENKEPYYLTSIETVEMSKEEFDKNLVCLENGKITLWGGNFIRFEKKTRPNVFPAILITQAVYNGYKSDNSKGNDIVNNWWKPQQHQIKNVKCKIFGSDLNWDLK